MRLDIEEYLMGLCHLRRGKSPTDFCILLTALSIVWIPHLYFLPLLAFSNELSRLTVNCVTSEDYSRPERIATFISTLHTGFRFRLSFDQLLNLNQPRLLNLKNDNLRKKFDGIKYDLKKVEEVVYDLSIRGLNKPVGRQAEGDKENAEELEESVDKDKTTS